MDSGTKFLDRLAALRAKLGLSREEMGRLLGVSGKYVGILERGDRDIAPDSSLATLVEMLASSTGSAVKDFAASRSVELPSTRQWSERAELSSRVREEPLPPVLRIRVVSMAQAGQIVDFEELPTEWQAEIAADCPDNKAFALELRGDSMEPKFSDGDLIIVMPSFKPRLHSYVVARLHDGGVIFKVLNAQGMIKAVPEGGEDYPMISLTSLNPSFQPITIAGDQLTWIHPVYSVIRKLW